MLLNFVRCVGINALHTKVNLKREPSSSDKRSQLIEIKIIASAKDFIKVYPKIPNNKNYTTIIFKLAESDLCASVIVPKLSDITAFKITFWMVPVICVACYVSIFPFIALGRGFFIKKFKLLLEETNNVNSILYLISVVASPFLILLLIKPVITWIGYCSFAVDLYNVKSLYGYGYHGLSYSVLTSSLWLSVALIVPGYQLGTAYEYAGKI
ncbi:hypothetical protein GQX74_009360 [Glossina fuscipes]|nr:hypothetical protein GQX74_009360 [Glossina fuscipes]